MKWTVGRGQTTEMTREMTGEEKEEEEEGEEEAEQKETRDKVTAKSRDPYPSQRRWRLFQSISMSLHLCGSKMKYAWYDTERATWTDEG